MQIIQTVVYNNLFAVEMRVPESRRKIDDRFWFETLWDFIQRDEALQVGKTTDKESGIGRCDQYQKWLS